MNRPILLVGEAPNRATEGRPHLWLLPDESGIQHSANRLLRLSGLERSEYLTLFDRTNVLHYWPGRAFEDDHASVRRIAGDRFNVDMGRLKGSKLVETTTHSTIIGLGKRVGASLGLGSPKFFEWRCDHPVNARRIALKLPEIRIAIIPHPSGANRWFNRADARGRFRRFFGELPELKALRADED